jgi:putative ABC transport system substrate-binding protein
MMNRRTFLCMLTAPALASPLTAWAQQAGKIARIAYVTFQPVEAAPLLHAAFRKGLQDLGYVAEQNLIIEYRTLDGKPERAPQIGSELISLRPDVIVVVNTEIAASLGRVTKTTPTVVITGGDYVATGLATSLARPGGTITGLAFLQSDLTAKRLQLLKQGVANLRGAVLAAAPGDRRFHEGARLEMEEAARQLGISMQLVRAASLADLEGVIARTGAEKASAMVLLADPFWWPHRARIAQLAIQHRVPTISDIKEFVEAGLLMSYGPDLVYFYRRAASYVDKILKGAKPGELPIEQPTKVEFVINLKTAKALGLTISQTLLPRADQIIE